MVMLMKETTDAREALLNYLEEHDMTVTAFAEMVGTSKQVISLMLCDRLSRPNRKHIAKINEVLGLDDPYEVYEPHEL